MSSSSLTLITVLLVCIIIVTLYSHNAQIAAIYNTKRPTQTKQSSDGKLDVLSNVKEGFKTFKPPVIKLPPPPPPPSFNPFREIKKLVTNVSQSINTQQVNTATNTIVTGAKVAGQKVVAVFKPPNYTTTKKIVQNIKTTLSSIGDIQKQMKSVNTYSFKMADKIVQANKNTPQYTQITYSPPNYAAVIPIIASKIQMHNVFIANIEKQMKDKTAQGVVESSANSLQTEVNNTYTHYRKLLDSITTGSIDSEIKRQIYGLDNVNVNFLTNYYKLDIIDTIERFGDRLRRNGISIWNNSRMEVSWFIRELEKRMSELRRPTINDALINTQIVGLLKRHGYTDVIQCKTDIEKISKNVTYDANTSIFYYLEKLSGLNTTLRNYVNVIEQNKSFFKSKFSLKLLIDYCAKFNIKENAVTPKFVDLSTFIGIVSNYDIHSDNFAEFIQILTDKTPFYTISRDPSTTLDSGTTLDSVTSFNNFITNVNTFRNMGSASLIAKTTNFKTVLQSVGISTYKSYLDVVGVISSKVNITTANVSIYDFIENFTNYYNNYKKTLTLDKKDTNQTTTFATLSPELLKIIPTIQFNAAVTAFFNEFSAHYKFGKSANTSLNCFVVNCIKTSKYMDQLKTETTPTTYDNIARCDPQTDYTYTPPTQAFSTMDDSDTLYQLIANWIQSTISYFTPDNTSGTKYIREHLTTQEAESNGAYLAILQRGFGVNNINDIPTANNTIMTENEFMRLMSTTVGVKDVSEVTPYLAFLASIHMPISEIQVILNKLQAFGVNVSNFKRFQEYMALLKANSYDVCKTLLTNLIAFGVNMQNLDPFHNELVKFGFTEQNQQSGTKLNALLEMLINYDITYKKDSPYDTCNAKFSNFVDNLTSDGIKYNAFVIFGPALLKTLNRGAEPTNASLKEELNKNMRDLIILRRNFFYKESDLSPFGNKECNPQNNSIQSPYTEITDLFVNPDKLSTFVSSYTTLFSQNSGPSVQFLFDKTSNTPKDTLRVLFYRHIVTGTPIPNQKSEPQFDYCEIANMLTEKEYEQMRNTPSILSVRSVMSRLLNKFLMRLSNYQEQNNTKMYNSVVNKINMISRFPHHSFYLIAQYLRNNDVKNGPYNCGDTNYQSSDTSIVPYMFEKSVRESTAAMNNPHLMEGFGAAQAPTEIQNLHFYNNIKSYSSCGAGLPYC